MNATSITRIAGLVGEAGRIQMLTALLDGNGHSASELAMAAAVSPQTASSHLSKLLSGGLIVSERNGRQRLFRLKSTDVAVAVEALGALAQNPGPSASLTPGNEDSSSSLTSTAGNCALCPPLFVNRWHRTWAGRNGMACGVRSGTFRASTSLLRHPCSPFPNVKISALPVETQTFIT